MSILVTGGSGAIGSWVVRKLVEEGQKPIVYDLRPSTALIPDVKDDITVIQGDVRDYARLLKVIKDYGIERIIHLAVELGAQVRESDPYVESRTIVDGTTNVLEIARVTNIPRVVFTSSRAVYLATDPKFKRPPWEPIPEEEARPGGSAGQGIYSAGKFFIERVGIQYASLGLDCIALRFGVAYGPGKIATHGAGATRASHAALVVNASRGVPTKLERGGDGVTDAVYFRDVAKGILKACFVEKEKVKSRVYNISSGEGFSLKQWAEVVKKVFPKASIEVGPGPLSDIGMGGGVLDITKARKDLSYEPDYPLQKGIEEFVKDMERLNLIG
jgi:nucleoside-diphosphate-sugar epimerase